MIGGMESLSFFEAVVRFPGALVRLPSSAQATLEAVNDVAERMDRLMGLLERLEGGVNRAGSGIDFATLGISSAVAGLEQAVGILDASLPSLSDSAAVLRLLTERLSGVAMELASELPKATRARRPPWVRTTTTLRVRSCRRRRTRSTTSGRRPT